MRETELLQLLHEYNRIHLELVRCVKMHLTEGAPPSARSDASTPARNDISTPVRNDISTPLRSESASKRHQQPRTQITPLGRVVRQREEWDPSEKEMFLDILQSYPNRPPAFYQRKLALYGFDKSIAAIQNKIKNLESAMRKSYGYTGNQFAEPEDEEVYDDAQEEEE
jgi:hypothetical protein